MIPDADHVYQVSARLASILERPEVFGLGPSVPQPLANALKGMIRTLGEATDEQDDPIPEDDLERELSQDTA